MDKKKGRQPPRTRIPRVTDKQQVAKRDASPVRKGENKKEPKLNDPEWVKKGAKPLNLPKLAEEKAKAKEKLQRNGPRPEPPKSVPRPMNDRRAIIVGSLMNREMAKAATEGFVPDPFLTDDIWLNPDNENEIQPDKLIVFFGKRRTGKSYAARSLLFTGRYLFNYGMVLANTEFNQYWQQYFPEDYVHTFDPIILTMFLKVQGKEMKSWKKAGMPRSHNPYKLIVLDDVVNQGFRYVDQLNTFATTGRHFGTCVVLMTQYPKLISSATRTNTDFAFVFFQQNIIEKMAIAEEYLNTIPLENALDMIEEYTDIPEGQKSRTILVLDQMTNTRNLVRKVFTYKPTDPGEFVVGCPAFWKNDARYELLVRKGAFQAWEEYDYYLKSQGQRQDQFESGTGPGK